MSPRVSVIIPTYNRADLLPRAVQSVLDQDFTDLELLVVDDGSTDHTGEIVQSMRDQDSRVWYLRIAENRGIGYARNFGLRNAKGDFIAWIDSDDVWLPGTLQEKVRILETYADIDILFTDFLNINLINDTQANAFIAVEVALRMLETAQLEEDLFYVVSGMEFALLRKMIVQLGTAIFRAGLIKIIGSFNTILSGPEDFEFVWRAAVKDCRFAFMCTASQIRYVDSASFTSNKATSLYKTIQALQICRSTGETLQRYDLRKPIREAQLRNWRNLIWVYGKDGARLEAIQAYRQSKVAVGFSLRSLVFYLAALLGPRCISLFQAGLRLRNLGN